jgi:Thioesterase-like superfamily
VTLIQDGAEEVVGYITQSNITAEVGPTFPTNFKLDPVPPPANLALLDSNSDPKWHKRAMPFDNFRAAAKKLIFHLPKQGSGHESVSDQWIQFANGENFTNESLGFVCDMFPLIIENYRPDSPYKATEEQKKIGGPEPPVSNVEGGVKPKNKDRKVVDTQWVRYWYPTLLLNIDVKKALPEGGVKWLQTRNRSKLIKNGRMDIDVAVYDEGGDLVALSSHVVLIVDASRNTAKRSEGRKKEASL